MVLSKDSVGRVYEMVRVDMKYHKMLDCRARKWWKGDALGQFKDSSGTGTMQHGHMQTPLQIMIAFTI